MIMLRRRRKMGSSRRRRRSSSRRKRRRYFTDMSINNKSLTVHRIPNKNPIFACIICNKYNLHGSNFHGHYSYSVIRVNNAWFATAQHRIKYNLNLKKKHVKLIFFNFLWTHIMLHKRTNVIRMGFGDGNYSYGIIFKYLHVPVVIINNKRYLK